MQREDTMLDSLRAVRKGGSEGTTLRDYCAAMWPDRARTGRQRCAGGKMLVELVRLGLVAQWGPGNRGRARYTLTPEGETYLREHNPGGVLAMRDAMARAAMGLP